MQHLTCREAIVLICKAKDLGIPRQLAYQCVPEYMEIYSHLGSLAKPIKSDNFHRKNVDVVMMMVSLQFISFDNVCMVCIAHSGKQDLY